MEKLYSCRNCVLNLFFLLFVVFSANAVSGLVSYEGESVVLEGKSFEIICRISVFQPVKWLRDMVALNSDNSTKITLADDQSAGGYLVVSKLSITNAQRYHSGEYKCSPFVSLSHTVVVMGANEIKGNHDFESYKVFDFKNKTLVLQCNLTLDTAVSDAVLKWTKNGKLIEEKKDKIEIKAGSIERTLTISKPDENDAGNYSCVLTNEKTNTSDLKVDFIVLYRPYVKLPPHTSVVEGEKLIINCVIVGSQPYSVEWRVGNKTILETEGRIIIEDIEDKDKDKDQSCDQTVSSSCIPNGRLRIDSATLEDRNNYTCIVKSLANRNVPVEDSTFVRVKDKLAALWPFLGICAEVIVLCTIILIYEKKRNKTELDESDTDGSPEQKNTPDHGKESEIRHRK